MLFDEPGAAWDRLGIPGHPAAILFDADGAELRRWFGPLDFDAIRAELA